MMAYLYLIIAIFTEVAGTLSLRMATSQPKKKGRPWLLAVMSGYGIAFYALAMTLAQGLALGVAYGIWAATGVALTANLSRIFFKEPLTKLMAVGIGLIIIGVLMIELDTTH